MDLVKMHFKKQFLSVSVIEEGPRASVLSEEVPPEMEVQVQSISRVETEPSVPHVDDPGVTVTESKTVAKQDSSLSGPTHSSHIGKEDKDCPGVTLLKDGKKGPYQSDSTLPGSESDGDSVRTSSSQKSADPKSSVKSESQTKEVKKLPSGSKVEESDTKSRNERSEKAPSHSKSDREDRRTSTRSSRSDKDRRRTKSRSRSRSRGPRTSSSYSRSERSRSERQSRSDRSHYHESDRRSHRSSPHKESRSSRSRAGRRSRDSSDSEDDHRRTRTRGSDTSRTSTRSSSQKDPRSSYSKSHKDSKSGELSRLSELDKKAQYSKSERSSGRTYDSENSKRHSPDSESVSRKSGTHSKTESSSKLFNSSPSSSTRSSEKKARKSSGSSDSDEEHKRKSQSQGSDRSSGSWSSSSKKTDKHDSISSPSVTASVIRPSADKLSSPSRQPALLSPDHEVEKMEVGSRQSEASLKSDSSEGGQKVSRVLNLKDDLNDSSIHIANSSPSKCQSSQNVVSLQNQLSPLLNNAEKVSCEEVDSTVKQMNDGHDAKGCSTNNQIDTSNHGEVKESTSSLLEKQVNVAYLNSVSENNDLLLRVNKVVGPDNSICQNLDSSKVNMFSVKKSPCSESLTQDTKSDDHIHSSVDVNPMPLCTDITSCVDPLSKGQDTKKLIVKEDQPGPVPLKKPGNVKKSRWDIVGQDTPECEIPQKIVSQDAKPPVKKVVSVKRIEFNKDDTLEDPCNRKDSFLKKNTEVDCKTSLDGQKVERLHTGSLEMESLKRQTNFTLHTEPCKVRSNHLESKCTTEQETVENHTSGTNSDAQAQANVCAGNLQNDRPKTKLSKALNEDGRGHSEDSDSDDSESDSDDGTVPLKRLSSVVVVPKNSTLTLETKDTPAFSSTSGSASGQQQMFCPTADAGKESGHLRHKATPSVAFENSNHWMIPHQPAQVPAGYQSQSNMVDSTSQFDAPNALSHFENNSTNHEGVKINNVSSHVGFSQPTDLLGGAGQSCSNFEKPDSWHSNRTSRNIANYIPGHLRNSNDLNTKENFSPVYGQHELPSSTYQQPDSSHGALSQNFLQQGHFAPSQLIRQGLDYWSQPLDSHAVRVAHLHVPSHRQDPLGQIHPDSLTNDHEEEAVFRARRARESIELPAPSGFVQANEISSNCKGFASTIQEGAVGSHVSKEEPLRVHRGRGPPKKRRQELESDSDNEAEVVLASKRECLESDLKDATAHNKEQRPLLSLKDFFDPGHWKDKAKSKKMPPYFDLIEENLYLTER